MSQSFDTFPIKLLKRNIEIIMNDTVISENANNIYEGQIGINSVNINGTATFNEDQPMNYSQNLEIIGDELYIFQNDVKINSEITIKDNGELRIIDNN